MKEEERKELNLLLNIINIDNKLKIVMNTTKEAGNKENITEFDVICIDEMLKHIYTYIERIKKYDIDYNKIKILFENNKNELTQEQKEAITEIIQQNNDKQ